MTDLFNDVRQLSEEVIDLKDEVLSSITGVSQEVADAANDLREAATGDGPEAQ